MVSSWAGTGGWRVFFDGGDPAPATTRTTCNQQQASTIGNLAPTTDLVATNSGALLLSEPLQLAPVDNPEPGTWFLMAGGLGVIGYLRRRKSDVQ